jgi:ribonuclease HI
MDRTSNKMEYCGLLEGLIWALQLDPKLIKIFGDSALVLGQVSGHCQVKDSKMKAWHAQDAALLGRKSSKTSITYFHVPREDNWMADLLANRGIDSRENVAVCNWNNINNFVWIDRND